MRTISYYALLTAIILVSSGCAAFSPDYEHVAVLETDTHFKVTAPVSKLQLGIPRAQFELLPERQNPHQRYFYLEDKISGIVFSGWFEPDRFYPGIDSLWQKALATSLKQGIPEPTIVEFERSEGHGSIIYSYEIGSSLQTHMRVEVVRSGTWIDLHLSLTSKGTHADNRRQLEALFKTVTIDKK